MSYFKIPSAPLRENMTLDDARRDPAFDTDKINRIVRPAKFQHRTLMLKYYATIGVSGLKPSRRFLDQLERTGCLTAHRNDWEDRQKALELARRLLEEAIHDLTPD